MPERDTRIAFITYETPFAPAGGVAAVMGRLPHHLQKATGVPTAVLTPFHYRIPKTDSLRSETKLIGSLSVPFEEQEVRVDILKLQRDIQWYFLRAEGERFFGGWRHPYDLREEGTGSAQLLKRDALFFGAAAARALPAIAPWAAWILMLQDWEAATAALAIASHSPLPDHGVFLTLHNSYDSGVTDVELLSFGIDPVSCPGVTVLDRALPIVEEPVFTVSKQFALDFTEEILQARIMAPHLIGQLSSRLIGVNNGLFSDLSVDEKTLDQARRGEFTALREWKSANRARAIQALDEFVPSPDRPVWGRLEKFKRDDAPWFILAGRDDSRQKGYDVACRAIDLFLSEGREARFLFFPIPGDEGLPGLAFLKKLAERYPESVLALPFIFQEGYFAALQGATYGVMPSLYEPFGMANEFYLKGTVGIGRATGGILQQIVPLRSAASFSQSAERRANRWHSPSAAPTGFLYREPDNLPSAVSDWQVINAADYELVGKGPDRVEQRQRLPLFRAMTNELALCLQDTVRVYRGESDRYDRMLIDGIDYILSTFSWEKAAQYYARYLF